MTGGEYGRVDLDLLADYVGGALEGTPDEAAVAALVTDDPAWRAAYQGLTAALGPVGADLRALGATTGPMPDDVAARLDAALAAQAGAVPVGAAAGPGRHLSAVPDTDRPGPGPAERPSTAPGRPSTTTRRRTRWQRWAAPVAAAAGVVAFAGIGVGYLADQQQGSDDSAAGMSTSESETSGDVQQPAAGGATKDDAGRGPNPPGAAANAPAADRIVASGTDYTRTTLGTTPGPSGRTTVQVAPDTGSAVPTPLAAPLDRLDRLSRRDALAACLDAIAAAHDEGPTTVSAVDFATFEGAPAVIVFFVDRDGDRWVWASGPACGLPTVGADTLGSAPVV